MLQKILAPQKNLPKDQKQTKKLQILSKIPKIEEISKITKKTQFFSRSHQPSNSAAAAAAGAVAAEVIAAAATVAAYEGFGGASNTETSLSVLLVPTSHLDDTGR